MPPRLTPQEALFEITQAERWLYQMEGEGLKPYLKNRIRYLLKNYPLVQIAAAEYAVEKAEVDDE